MFIDAAALICMPATHSEKACGHAAMLPCHCRREDTLRHAYYATLADAAMALSAALCRYARSGC